MSLITISDLTTSESFISEISEIETSALLGGKAKTKNTFNFNGGSNILGGGAIDGGSGSGTVVAIGQLNLTLSTPLTA
ncbi:hypothetical protein G7B40_002470 [Aetokthonos hydrillicola Thurmond2011]|jgi:hypothetical protein|uniref:Uncharacterized protein n=1 Tax=Aetokthonos hydrillicola Thurmond2011 TaxID=2712845 RepID=A0AAP5I1L1_9CYAN|nr:hypothetical protein [Aetokthonos hydrillicola]MBO3462908.1 hypothetical protein [Aetokthonos hydrillicola CCALA 1050]MBW4588139.1 hypothetical protein [Aetokthonos hydrillicola CCALA 1050]MDR9893453.1 hypothetical protein [Aetokthonos hydrillicola Thurmond2011]